MKLHPGILIVFLVTGIWFLGGRESEFEPEGRGKTRGTPTGSFPSVKIGTPSLNSTSVKIVPSFPDLQSVLKVKFQGGDQIYDGIVFRYRWFVNQIDVSNKAFLPLTGFRQGDLVSVEVIPSDDRGVGSPIQSPLVEIKNNPPVVKTIQFLPPEVKPGINIKAEVKGLDKDGDPISFGYEWYIDGQPVEGSNESILDGKFVYSGDKVFVIVTPSDPFSEGILKKSHTITAINLPPEITSNPPTEILNNIYTYQVLVKNSDGDPLKYQLLEGPPGMNIDPTLGLLNWKIKTLPAGKIPVKIQVDDSKGGKTLQRFFIQTESGGG